MKFDCNIAEMEAVELPALAAKTPSEIDCKRYRHEKFAARAYSRRDATIVMTKR